MQCDPGDHRCVIARRYYRTDFMKPNPYNSIIRNTTNNKPRPNAQRPRPTPTPQPTPRPSNPPPTPPRPSDPTQPNEPPRLTVTAPRRPLKVMSKLTPEQVRKGRMVAAAYELDHRINQEMRYTNQKMATNTILKQSESVLRQTELAGWKVLDANHAVGENLSDKQYLVLEKGNEVKIVFRGRAGDNHVDNTHVADALKGKARDYTYLDDLIGELSVLRPDANIEVISYSNGGPKGLYLSEKYGLPHHTIDPVLGPKEVTLLTKRGPDSAPLDLVRTNRPALASGMGQTAQQILTGNEAHINTINVAPVKSEGHPLAKIVDAHDLSHYALMGPGGELNPIPESERAKVGIVGRNALGSVVSGIAPAALASAMVEGVTPDAPHEAKLAETAATTSALTKVAAPLLGAGSASMASTLLPLYASFEAADKVGQGVDAVLPDDLHDIPREMIKGGASGAAGGAAFTTATAAQSAATTALTSATTATAAAAEGVELAAFGTGAAVAAEEVGVAAAAGAGALAGAEAGSFLAPETLGLSVLAGSAIGATVGLFSGLFG